MPGRSLPAFEIMTYPGNTSLAPDVQQRILTTYRQSLQSAGRGNREEALLGCDFILRLDPQFGLARTLQQMISAGQPVETFQALLAEATGAAPPAGAADLRATFAQLLENRRFAELLNAAERDQRQIASSAELRAMVEIAQSRYEADPYVVRFADQAEIAIRSGNQEEARALVEKARALDASHPRIAELQQMLGMPAGVDLGAGADGALELPEVDFSSAAEGFDIENPAAGEGGERPAEETSGRIVQLLGEGQLAFERGEYQGAIDAWSRIFLIDIDHEEAARKIERARQLKAEREREVEEVFHDGVGRFDSGDLPGARVAFQRVLELNPGYALAREYLEKLDEREAGGALPGASLPELAPIVPAAPAAPRGPSRDAPPSGEVVPQVAPKAPRERARRPVGPGYAATAKRGGARPSPRFLVIGGVVLALLVAGGWFLFNRRDRLFLNATPAPPPAATPDAADPIARARALHDEGKTAVAVAQLRRLPPVDPQYAEAQSLISQWERLGGTADAPQAGASFAAARRELLGQAQQALADGENFRARRLFQRAAELAPLDGDWVAMSTQAEEQLRPLARELQIFKDGDYETVLNQLWRRREAEPSNRDVARMIVDAYFNLGVLDLQRGDPVAAREKFREARAIDGSDPALQRLESFAAAYAQKNQDLLYRIFVKYLTGR